MDRTAAAVLAVAFTAWLGWTGYVHSEEWVKTARRWRAGMTSDGYAKWARDHDGEFAEVVLSAAATVARLANRAAGAFSSFAGRRTPRPDPAVDDMADDPTIDADEQDHDAQDVDEQHDGPQDIPAAPDSGTGTRPDPAAEPPRTGPPPETSPRSAQAPAPVPFGEPMANTERPKNGEIIGLRAVLAGWARLIASGENDRAQADHVASSARKLTDSSEALCDQINSTLTVLGQLEAACYRHSLEPAALTRVHEAMEAAGAALTAQRRAHNAVGAASSSMRTAASAHAAAIAAFRAALDHLNRTHRLKAEVEASTGARSDRDFGTS
ncbi:hypothetical protein [Actinomadura violacea]|uniref:Uncharacterized protein n=1 Tax=Actinomadura violacea TaxID=2819934 RepID=A0ABS3S4U7_9ACTN|nr:hypothetical protein [Actinomadura violacea]MBO2464022.1 hypothetical protein [Actinomadura violacea]